MKQRLTLTIASLLTLVLSSIHFAHDTLHMPESTNDPMAITILLAIMLLLLYGTVELAGKRAGFVIMMLGGLAAAYMPYLHSLGPRAARWGFSFVWGMMAMGVSGVFTAVLAAKELWRSFQRARTELQERSPRT